MGISFDGALEKPKLLFILAALKVHRLGCSSENLPGRLRGDHVPPRIGSRGLSEHWLCSSVTMSSSSIAKPGVCQAVQAITKGVGHKPVGRRKAEGFELVATPLEGCQREIFLRIYFPSMRGRQCRGQIYLPKPWVNCSTVARASSGT